MYDATAFLRDHPGGAESILLASGMDASDDFNAIHSAKAKKMVEEYYIGDLDDSAGMPLLALQALLAISSVHCCCIIRQHLDTRLADMFHIRPQRSQQGLLCYVKHLLCLKLATWLLQSPAPPGTAHRPWWPTGAWKT